jgi:hypothetical protein
MGGGGVRVWSIGTDRTLVGGALVRGVNKSSVANSEFGPSSNTEL